MKQLSWNELVATAEVWRSQNDRCFGVFCSVRQFLFVIASIGEIRADHVTISIQEVIKRLEIAPEQQFSELTLTPSVLLSAWHSTTFEQPSGFITETFDEVIQLLTSGDVTSATLYHASQFRRTKRAG